MPTPAELNGTSRRKRSPLGNGLGAVMGVLIRPLYEREINRRNRAYDAGEGVTRLEKPVVSIGNLSVGGTGKTPMVAAMVNALVRAGKTPCIAMRGYGKKKKGGVVGISDEEQEYLRLLPGVPVVAQPDRIAGLRALFETPAGKGVNVVVLDDGFQHRKIARDVDVVLIDASAGTLEDRLLPAGWLREPMESLKRAHAVVITHAERAEAAEVDRIRRAARAINPLLVVATARHEWSSLRRREAGMKGAESVRPVSELAGKRVFVTCGIGNPDAFVAAVRAAGAMIGSTRVWPDHHLYDEAATNEVIRSGNGLDGIITTEKDWTKLERRRVEWPCPVYRPTLEMVFEDGWEGLWGLIDRRVG